MCLIAILKSSLQIHREALLGAGDKASDGLCLQVDANAQSVSVQET